MDDRHTLKQAMYTSKISLPVTKETKEIWNRLKTEYRRNPSSIAREAIEQAFTAYIQELESLHPGEFA